MKAYDLTPVERATLLVLVARAEPVSNTELRDEYGIKLLPAHRQKLGALGLIVSTATRPITHELTDPGWRFCAEEEFRAGARRLPGLGGGALHALTESMGRFIERNGYSLADVFASKTGGSGHVDLSQEEVEEQIRKTYQRLSGKPGAWVSLADIRGELQMISQKQMDATLIWMAKRKAISLIPESNQKAMPARDKQAAVKILGQHKHLIAISGS